MRKCWAVTGLLLLSMLAGGAHASTPDRRIALTVDDLPWQGLEARDEPELATLHARLLSALTQAGIPVIGFVNENKLEVDGVPQPARLQLLRDWLAAGLALGNHTYGHLDLHTVTRHDYQQDILRGETQLRPLLAESGQALRWFRHPYLHAGQSAQAREELQAFLGQHGYRVAPVTVDNSEWIWALAYDRVRESDADAAQREALLRRLREGYVPYMLNKLDYNEQRSAQLLGRLPAQAWLIHANALNADSVGELVAATHRRGYRFITLDQALEDPAYQRADDYNGGAGISWIQRWAMTEKMPRSFYADEPLTPAWVLSLAGVDEE